MEIYKPNNSGEQFLGSLEVLACPNPDYALSADEMADQGLSGKPVFEKLYIIERSRLLEDVDDAAGTSVIRVMGGGAQIGQIRREDISHVHMILSNYDIVSTEVSVSGGPWKKAVKGEGEEFSLTEGTSSLTGQVTVYYTQKESAPAPLPAPQNQEPQREEPAVSAPAAPEKEDDDVGGWIDTSYVTEIREKNESDYGMTLLFFSAIISVCYLCFALPCWITGRSAEFFDVLTIGGMSLKEPVLLYHLITLGGALICNIIAVFTAGNLMPSLAALLYALSGLLLPGYLFCTGVQALLCIFAAFRKRKGSKSVKWILFIAVAALLALEIWQFVQDEILFNPFGETQVAAPNSGEEGDEDYFTDDDFYYMDESEMDLYWDADAEGMDVDYFFEDESDFFFEDESDFLDEEAWEEENGVIDMGVEPGSGLAGELPSPLGGAAGLAGISTRP